MAVRSKMGASSAVFRSVSLLEALVVGAEKPGQIIYCSGGINNAIEAHAECMPQAFEKIRSHMTRNGYKELTVFDTFRDLIAHGYAVRSCLGCQCNVDYPPHTYFRTAKEHEERYNGT